MSQKLSGAPLWSAPSPFQALLDFFDVTQLRGHAGAILRDPRSLNNYVQRRSPLRVLRAWRRLMAAPLLAAVVFQNNLDCSAFHPAALPPNFSAGR